MHSPGEHEGLSTITALLIDDEEHNRDILRTLLSAHCPSIKILGEAACAADGYHLIKSCRPQLVFLDVMMPEESGFDLLKRFDAIDFEVIFVSAFNEFAITAFDYNALGYIIKPIDFNKLIAAVKKAILKIGLNDGNDKVLQFVHTLDSLSDSIAKIAVHHKDKVLLIDIGQVISIHTVEGICHIATLGNHTYFSSRDLKLFDGMLSALGNFARISKSTIINLDHLKSYQKGDICILEMVNGSEFEVSRRKKTEILQRIKIL